MPRSAVALSAFAAACAQSPTPRLSGEAASTPTRSAQDAATPHDDASMSAPDSERRAHSQRSASGGFRELAVPGFLPAVLYVPSGADARPLIVANHGAGGAPEYECEYWRRLTAARAFVLCLRGSPIDTRGPSGFYYKDHLALGRELQAALGALRSELGARVRDQGALYTGFSQGAIMGAPMIVSHAKLFSRLALIEGGYEYWSAVKARTFARNGGQRVLFVCGTRWCAEKSELPAQWLRKERVAVRIEYAPGAGHTPGGEVMAKLAAALPWLFEGDGAWAP